MYTVEFKKQVAKAGLKAKTYSEVGKNYGVSSSLVKKWTNELRTYGDYAFIDGGVEKYNEMRLLQLEKEVQDLREENEILKKATAFFSRGNL